MSLNISETLKLIQRIHDISATKLKINDQHDTTEMRDAVFKSKMLFNWTAERDQINGDNIDNCARAVEKQTRISNAVSMVTAA